MNVILYTDHGILLNRSKLILSPRFRNYSKKLFHISVWEQFGLAERNLVLLMRLLFLPPLVNLMLCHFVSWARYWWPPNRNRTKEQKLFPCGSILLRWEAILNKKKKLTILKWKYNQRNMFVQELRILKNFSSLKAIISRLQSLPIYRLQKTWQVVSKEKVRNISLGKLSAY